MPVFIYELTDFVATRCFFFFCLFFFVFLIIFLAITTEEKHDLNHIELRISVKSNQTW